MESKIRDSETLKSVDDRLDTYEQIVQPVTPNEVRRGSFNINKLMKFKETGIEIAKLSKDRRVKISALAFDDDYNLLGNGYNGFPRGVDDSKEERHLKPTKYLYSAHAEENLIAQSAKTGRSLNGSTVMVVGRHPCASCTRMLIQSGVKRIVCPKPDIHNVNWKESNLAAYAMLMESGIDVYYLEELRSDLLGLEAK